MNKNQFIFAAIALALTTSFASRAIGAQVMETPVAGKKCEAQKNFGKFGDYRARDTQSLSPSKVITSKKANSAQG